MIIFLRIIAIDTIPNTVIETTDDKIIKRTQLGQSIGKQIVKMLVICC